MQKCKCDTSSKKKTTGLVRGPPPSPPPPRSGTSWGQCIVLRNNCVGRKRIALWRCRYRRRRQGLSFLISAWMLKATLAAAATELGGLYRTICRTKNIPSDRYKRIVLKIPRKADETECGNWRGITLLWIPRKVHSNIITQRICTLCTRKACMTM